MTNYNKMKKCELIQKLIELDRINKKQEEQNEYWINTVQEIEENKDGLIKRQNNLLHNRDDEIRKLKNIIKTNEYNNFVAKYRV